MNATDSENLKLKQDERMGLPSASEAHRWMACPGYLDAKARWPHIKEEASDVRDAGTKMHEVMEYVIDGQVVEIPLSSREEWITDRMKQLKDQLIAQVFGEPDAVKRHVVEQRLFVADASGEKRFTAKPDYMGTDCKGTWVILEYKTGPKPVPDASQNWQIATSAAALASRADLMEAAPLNQCFGAIIQPLATLMPAIVKLSSDQVVALRTQMLSRLRAVANSKVPQPRVPGSHCGYCPVRHACFEYSSTAVIAEKQWGALGQLSPAQLVEIHRILPAIEDRVTEVRRYIKQMLREDPLSIPGLALKTVGSGYDSEDLVEFMRALAPIVSREEFWGSAEVSVSKMRDLWVQRMAIGSNLTQNEALKLWKQQFEPILKRRPDRELIIEVPNATQTQAQLKP